jgi:hypothetical protein
VLSSTLPIVVLAGLRSMRGRRSRAAHAASDAALQAAALRALADTLPDPRCAADLRAAADRHEHCPTR